MYHVRHVPRLLWRQVAFEKGAIVRSTINHRPPNEAWLRPNGFRPTSVRPVVRTSVTAACAAVAVWEWERETPTAPLGLVLGPSRRPLVALAAGCSFGAPQDIPPFVLQGNSVTIVEDSVPQDRGPFAHAVLFNAGLTHANVDNTIAATTQLHASADVWAHAINLHTHNVVRLHARLDAQRARRLSTSCVVHMLRRRRFF